MNHQVFQKNFSQVRTKPPNNSLTSCQIICTNKHQNPSRTLFINICAALIMLLKASCDRRLKQAAFAMKMSVFTLYHFHRLCTSFHQHVLHWLFSSIPGVHKDTKSMLQSEIWQWKSCKYARICLRSFTVLEVNT